MLTEKKILDALSSIIDPDLNKDIVSLGFIKNLKIDNAHVSFDIELTTPACPIKDKFKTDAQNCVKAVAGVQSVEVTMTAIKKKLNDSRTSGLSDVGSIIAISSCKGGVGKSTIAAMVARELASQGHRVGLLDADVHGPSVPTLFNKRCDGVRVTEDKFFVPVKAEGLQLMSFGFLSGDAPAVMRGPMVGSYMQQMLHNVAWGELDYLIIDMPPGTSDIMLTITQQIQIDGAVIVTTPHSLSLTDVGKGIISFDRVNVPCLGVIENMSYYVCDGCNKKHYIFGKAGAKQIQERFGLDILAELPISDDLGNKPKEIVGEIIKAVGKQMLSSDKTPELSFDEQYISLKWSSGKVIKVANHDLRVACQCATCVDEMTGNAILDPTTVPIDVKAEEVKIIGNYALQVAWSDGHNTGLFPFKRIRQLAVK